MKPKTPPKPYTQRALREIARVLREAAPHIVEGNWDLDHRHPDEEPGCYDAIFCCYALRDEDALAFFSQYFRSHSLYDSHGHPAGWFGVPWLERNQDARRLALLLAAEIAEDLADGPRGPSQK